MNSNFYYEFKKSNRNKNKCEINKINKKLFKKIKEKEKNCN